MKFRVYRRIEEIEGDQHRVKVSLIADENGGALMELTGPASELGSLQHGASCELGVP